MKYLTTINIIKHIISFKTYEECYYYQGNVSIECTNSDGRINDPGLEKTEHCPRWLLVNCEQSRFVPPQAASAIEHMSEHVG